MAEFRGSGLGSSGAPAPPSSRESPIPPQVVDFIKNFYQAVKVGRIPEIAAAYDRVWRQISQQFYSYAPWPSVREVAPLVRDDAPFLSLYALLAHRHQLLTLPRGGTIAPLSTFVSAWHAYRAWFDIALSESAGEWVLPYSWVYDVLSEFVYFFETFQRRLVPPTTAAAVVENGGASAEALALGDALSGVWALADVLKLLHALADKSGIAAPGAAPLSGDAAAVGFRALCGYLASVCLVRIYGKLADYGSALEAARPLGVGAPDAPYTRIAAAHATLIYYASFALMQSRRYEDALRALSRSLRALQQQYRVLEEGGGNASDFLRKQAAKMLHLAALAAACCPGVPIDDLVARKIKERHAGIGDVIADLADAAQKDADRAKALAAKPAPAPAAEGEAEAEAEAPAESEEALATAAAEAALDRVFEYASPGFLALTPASLSPVEAVCAANKAVDALYAAQLRLFKQEVFSRAVGSGGGQLRSVLKMYTSISLPKLASAAGLDEPAVRAALTAIKLKGWAPAGGALAALASGAADVGGVSDALHFYLDTDVVYVEEARRSDNVASFFVNQIRIAFRDIARADAARVRAEDRERAAASSGRRAY